MEIAPKETSSTEWHSTTSLSHDNNQNLEAAETEYLMNTSVSGLSWNGCSVEVKDRKTKKLRPILENVSGNAKAGELIALMGPSGSGKTTLLNVLARKISDQSPLHECKILVNGCNMTQEDFREVSKYVEQEDALVGSLTVRETLVLSSRLATNSFSSNAARNRLVEYLITAFGLQSCSDSLIGTPIRKGISGGQKRRVSVASQLITAPKILFLDEPTSGLDSTASYETMAFIRDVAKKLQIIIIASIHQPGTATFQLFDNILLLSGGKQCYYGPVTELNTYFTEIGFPMPLQINPAEFVLELLNSDFSSCNRDAVVIVETIQNEWKNSATARDLQKHIETVKQAGQDQRNFINPTQKKGKNFLNVLSTLLLRSFIKSYRDVVVYGIRVAMYTGLAVMMGTVWLRLDTDQAAIQPRINAIFFGSAFMSFMAVAYVPAFLEDRAVFIKDRANGLYGAPPFLLANTLIGLPYLFGIALCFSLVTYFLSNFQPTAHAFFTWVAWLFLDLLAAEALVVLVAAALPSFVVALALVAFINGLWMSVGGFLVPPRILNAFWTYLFHYIDYQAYVFQGMMVNEFQDRTYTCGAECKCLLPTETACSIPGEAVLQQYGYDSASTGNWVGIMVGIIVAYRLLGWVALSIRKT